MAVLNFLLVLVGIRPAWATDVRFCVDVDVDFTDNLAGNVWEDNSVDRPARGFHFKVKDNATGNVIHNVYLNESGQYKGCTGLLSLTYPGDYKLLVPPDGTMNGNTFEHVGNGAGSLVLDAHYAPPASGPVQENYVIDGTIVGGMFQQLVVVATALYRHDGGLTGEAYSIDFTTTNPHFTAPTIFLPEDEGRKQSIAHELGHAIAYNQVGVQLHEDLDPADIDGCDGSAIADGTLDKRFQSKAITEGIADWYAAITWNDRDISLACQRIFASGQDFDLDEIDDAVGGVTAVTCSGVPFQSGVDDWYTGNDWLEELIDAPDQPLDCSGELANRSTSYDWLTYLWHLYADEGLDAEYIYLIYLDAVPGSWDPDESTTTTADDPWIVWDASATFFFPNEHAQWDHLVDH